MNDISRLAWIACFAMAGCGGGGLNATDAAGALGVGGGLAGSQTLVPQPVSITVKNVSSGYSLTVSLNGTDSITASSAGTYTFPTRILPGNRYEIAITTPPIGLNCKLSAGAGTMGKEPMTAPTVVCLSGDQETFERVFLASAGGGLGLVGNLPTSGLPNDALDHYLYGSTFTVAESPASAGTQTIQRSLVSIAETLLYVPIENVSYTMLRGGQFLGVPQVQGDGTIRYVGSAIESDVLADDGKTPVATSQYSRVALLPLTGSVASSFSGKPYAFLPTGGLAPLSTNAQLTKPNATWLPDSAVLTYDSTALSNRITVLHCSTSRSVIHPTPPNVCASGISLADWLTPRFGAAAAQSIVNEDGVNIWAPITSTASGNVTAYFELNGSIYMANYIPVGYRFGLRPNGGNPLLWVFNKPARDSIKAALTF